MNIIMSPEEARDWLGLKEGASQTEIKKAWKRMLEKNHPDNVEIKYKKAIVYKNKGNISAAEIYINKDAAKP